MKVISAETQQILAPLGEYRSQIYGQPENPRLQGVRKRDDYEIITHADFVARYLLPNLNEVCERHGQETVATEIVSLVQPLYADERARWKPDDIEREIPWGNASLLLSHVIPNDGINDDGNGDGNISRNRTNLKLAERFGIQYVFEPIVDLTLAHAKYQVFTSGEKFLLFHACRMGELIGNFSREDYLAYVELAKKLLAHDLFDWSIEHKPEGWGMLGPSIRLYGLIEVFGPMVQAMIDVSGLWGTIDGKYKYSHLIQAIQGLYPILLPRVRKDGPGEIDKMLRPIVEFILKLGQKRYFQSQDDFSKRFFGSFGTNLPRIREIGITQYLAERTPEALK